MNGERTVGINTYLQTIPSIPGYEPFAYNEGALLAGTITYMYMQASYLVSYTVRILLMANLLLSLELFNKRCFSSTSIQLCFCLK